MSIVFEATPKATLVVGDRRWTVPDRGWIDIPIDIVDRALLQASVAATIGGDEGIVAPPVKLRLESPTAPPLDGEVHVRVEHGELMPEREHFSRELESRPDCGSKRGQQGDK